MTMNRVIRLHIYTTYKVIALKISNKITELYMNFYEFLFEV
jgi:hypothetical protein